MKIYSSTVHGNFPIYLGEDTRELLLEEVEKRAPDKVFIITDRTVEALHIENLKEQLPHAFEHEVIIFNEGEENKNLATLEHVAGDLLRAGITSNSLIINFGGGVVLNMGGLAASLIGRGIRFIQVPTTFASQWSVANTNRQAIHFVGERDRLGVYRTPELAVADTTFLETEPEEQIINGFVNLAKYALLIGGDSYDRVFAALDSPDAHRPPKLAATLRTGLELMIELHRDDPSEEKVAALDDYGWTLGRSLQLLSDGRLSPAEGILFGLRLSGLIARRRGLMDESAHKKHEALLSRIRITKPYPKHVRTDHYIYKLHGNNKTSVGELQIPLLENIGQPAAGGRVTVNDGEVMLAVEELRANA